MSTESNRMHMTADADTDNAWDVRRSRARRPGATKPSEGATHKHTVRANVLDAVLRPVDPAQPGAAVPIWLAALAASRCRATGNGEKRAVRWCCISGRALYTNGGADTELIQPLGVRLQGGQTVAVSWVPGETAYTVEVYGGNEHRA